MGYGIISNGLPFLLSQEVRNTAFEVDINHAFLVYYQCGQSSPFVGKNNKINNFIVLILTY